MITCILRLRFDVGLRAEAIQVLRTLVGPVRSQPGCTHTLLMLDVQDDAVITWVSRWKDRSVLDRHLLSTHFRRILAVMELAAERPDIAFECGSESRGIDLIHEVIGGADHPPDSQSGDLGIFEELMDARSLYLTANSTTVYCMTEVNVKDGPVVAEIPPGVLGPVDDAFFRFVTDIGNNGPDKGKGGKNLFVHRDYEGPIPGGYFVAETQTYRNLFFFRAFVKDGELKATADGVKAGFRMYPLAHAANPPEQRFVNLSGKQMNTVHANDFKFYEELNAVIQYEPADAFDSELVGLFASIGIKKGQPFEPDARMSKILTEAAAIGNATARAITFSPRKERYYIWPDRKWNTPFTGGGDYAFYDNGERMLDDRIFFHYCATGITPVMTAPKVGLGSVYGIAAQDANGSYLDGGKTYKVTLPGPVPAKDFWSFMVYDSQHRSMLETDQKLAGLDSLNPAVTPNADGSYTMWFGPTAPSGHESNWIQTMPGKSYNVLIRLYGPLQPFFDKTWKAGDFELVH